MWDKLGNVHEAVLANYLKNEYPQTVAVVLSKIRTDHAARVLTLLPDGFSIEVIMRNAAHGSGAEGRAGRGWNARCGPSSCPTSHAARGATRTR